MPPFPSHRLLKGSTFVPCESLKNARFIPVTWSHPRQLEGGNVDAPNLEKPWALASYALERIPACRRWFEPSAVESAKENHILSQRLNISYLKPFGEIMVPIEAMRTPKYPTKADVMTGRDQASSSEETFDRISAPLNLLLAYLTPPYEVNVRLYLAQFPLADLPRPLRDDLPTPSIINHIGKGDIYNSSLWMGLSPTYTSLHKDPNDNFFVQLAGRKTVRLIEPTEGRTMYDRVMRKLNRRGSSAMRGEEMMVGAEKEAFETAVWDDGAEEWKHVRGWEAKVKATDALFIPKGWWHSVRGEGEGEVNVSANWWFR
ncbi:Clavaminate synthase-like protein [Amniculicola lignicola CBS 123094]|uniref:Clavaminate synthase-like protein n=1 Tax=Amniculicola lignicola CBS 123094 TaxID=1392246 RepID=A0A6A5WPI4_9PLEO|nr:Clavaminate synthase-like protein [Amniculicola lignicola CBS 123094]